jgi:uncharacterized protein
MTIEAMTLTAESQLSVPAGPLRACLAKVDPRLVLVAATASRLYSVDDPGHDWLHIFRVTTMAARLGSLEGADLAKLLPAALLHDVVNLRKDDPKRIQASALAAESARWVLEQHGYTAHEIDCIAAVIREHSCTANLPPSSLESALLQDSDKLDAMGAIGVLRAAVCGARLSSHFYDILDPCASNRVYEDHRFLLDHLHHRLLRLHARLHTKSAREEGRQRAAFLRIFVRQLKAEIFGLGSPDNLYDSRSISHWTHSPGSRQPHRRAAPGNSLSGFGAKH